VEEITIRISLDELRDIGRSLGILSVNKFNKNELIRTIQLAEGWDECFGQEHECGDTECVWRTECRAGERTV